MKFLKRTVLITFAIASVGYGQGAIKSFDFKKGEVLDIILLNQTKNSKELFERYKKTAFPVAFKYTYQPQPSFGVSKLTLGTNKVDAFTFGKWSDIEKREGFLKNIAKEVPDFHQQRRELFPFFGLTYYQMKMDLKFAIDTSKFNVATALWNTPENKERAFFEKWVESVKNSGGKVVITLENGNSPLGYYYNADILCIVEWQNENDFETFAKEHPLSFYQSFRNVHQFVIE